MGLWYKNRKAVKLNFKGKLHKPESLGFILVYLENAREKNPGKVRFTSEKDLVVERELLFQILSTTWGLMPGFVSQASSLLKSYLSPTESLVHEKLFQ